MRIRPRKAEGVVHKPGVGRPSSFNYQVRMRFVGEGLNKNGWYHRTNISHCDNFIKLNLEQKTIPRDGPSPWLTAVSVEVYVSPYVSRFACWSPAWSRSQEGDSRVYRQLPTVIRWNNVRTMCRGSVVRQILEEWCLVYLRSLCTGWCCFMFWLCLVSLIIKCWHNTSLFLIQRRKICRLFTCLSRTCNLVLSFALSSRV